MTKISLNSSFYSLRIFKFIVLAIFIIIFSTNISSAKSQPSSETPVVDVMIVYTPAARQAAGGTEAIESIIQLAIDETNMIYRNSQVNGKLRLVHSEEVNYIETGNVGSDLDKFFKDNAYIVSLREYYGADLVSLFIKGKDGVAYLLQSKQQEAPFSAMDYLGAAGFYVFAHETGHNMGLCHDIINNNSCVKSDPTFYPYANGYNDPQGAFSDIMSNASDNCPGLGGCPHAPIFSNPNINFNGRPAGVLDSADNARALNETMPIVAQWETTKIIPSVYLPIIASAHLSPHSTQIVQLDTAFGAKISELDMATLSDSRFVTIGRNSSNTLILTLWELTSSGRLHVISSLTGFSVAKAKIAPLTSSRFATIAIDNPGNVRIDVWNVSTSGQISIVAGLGVAGRKSNDIAITALGSDRFTTIEQTFAGNNAGKTIIVFWKIAPSGAITGGEGVIAFNKTNGIEAITVNKDRIFLVSKQPNISGLQLEMWTISEDGQFLSGGTRLINITTDIAITSPNDHHMITATRNNKGSLELTDWNIVGPVFGRTTDIANTEIPATKIATSSLSNNKIATVLRDISGDSKIIVWGNTQSGSFTNLGSVNSGMISITSNIAVATLEGDRLVVAGQRSDGAIQISAWSVVN